MSTLTNLFGTDGIRARVGTPPFTPTQLLTLAQAIATWVTQACPNTHVAIAGDTRTSTPWVISELSKALKNAGISVHNCGILPTPALSALVQQDATLSLGIMVTASHNLYHDNGIKLFNRNGKITQAEEQTISALFVQRAENPSSLSGTEINCAADEWYLTHLRQFFAPTFLDNITMVIDCAHGATSLLAARAFSSFGATVHTINAAPNGTNINHECGAVHPRVLQAKVKELNATIGCAFDGDGDRLILVTKTGQIKDGDDILALLSHHPAYKDQRILVGTHMSNLGLERYIVEQQKTFIRTAVGDKYIHRALVEHKALLGGESSGHTIMQDYLPVGDGIFAALRCLEVIIKTNNYELATFNHYPQAQINIPITKKKALSEPPLSALLEEFKKKIPEGRTVIRYSGTEPVLRIMVEDVDEQYARSVCKAIANSLQKELS